ncbi:uncharacterized protein LOC134720712 [Mytilus trossulus]|uniref:uncharacterized protein LOC134720712 n=1 Tax=Mytilus trossulus TaxID=6551 RepID=UPI0030055C61
MNTRGQNKKRKSTTKTSSLGAATQEDTPPPMVTTVQDTDDNIPSNSGAVMHPVVTNRQGSPITIWIVGSSLVKNAFVQARRRPGGINLGQDHIGVRLWWLGKSGMRLKDLLNRIKLMLRYEEPPTYLVIPMGGNDLGEIKTGVLRNRLKHYVNNITELLLNTTLVWSQILPRLTWRYSADIDAMDRSRQRINSSLASYIIRHGGHYIRYPDISPNSTFICQDGVHLTDIGNYIFLNTIQGALEAFLVYSPHTFPECKS